MEITTTDFLMLHSVFKSCGVAKPRPMTPKQWYKMVSGLRRGLLSGHCFICTTVNQRRARNKKHEQLFLRELSKWLLEVFGECSITYYFADLVPVEDLRDKDLRTFRAGLLTNLLEWHEAGVDPKIALKASLKRLAVELNTQLPPC